MGRGGSAPVADVLGLLPLVPMLAAELDDPGSGAAVHQRDGSVLFADVTGFTALCERLVLRGRQGVEEITDLIAQTFTELLLVAEACGGSLLKFGGDALLLVFLGGDHARRAAHAAVEFRRALRRQGRVATSAGPVQLRMSMGLHSAPLLLVTCGASSRELLLVGAAADGVLAAEGRAAAGQIVLSADAARSLPARCITPRADGQPSLARSPGIGSPAPLPRPVADPAIWVPTAVRAHVLGGGGAGEHRQAAVAFIEAAGVAEVLAGRGPQAVADEIGRVVSFAQSVADDTGVSCLATDVAVDGIKILLAAGVPAAREDDHDLLVHACRRIVKVDSALRVRAGAHAGPVFCGLVGPGFARSYVAMGDTVNTAARVLGHAPPGRLLASRELLSRCSRAWTTDPGREVQAKGKRHPIEAAVVGVAVDRAATAAQLPLLGRDDELQRAVAATGAALGGEGIGVAIVGPAGIGSSRLAAEVASVAGAADVITARADATEAAVPYTFLRQLLRPLLELPATPSRRDAEQVLAAVAAIDPQSGERPGLVGALLGVDIEPAPAEADLPPSSRSTYALTTALAIVRQARAGTVVLLDGVDRADASSRRLLENLASNLVRLPVALVSTSRSAPPWRAEVVDLAPLELPDMAALVREAAAELTSHLVQRIARRADGNPAVALQLVDEVRRGSDPDELPATVERLAARRIDALDPQRRDLARALSVLGQSCSGADAVALTGASLHALRRLSGVVELHHDQLVFGSGWLRDAAYEGLPRRQRVALHARAAAIIEARPPRHEEDAVLLARHYLAAGDAAGGWRWSLAAAAQLTAAAAWPHVEQVLRRALLSAEDAGADDAAIAQAWFGLGRARFAIGDHDGAERALSQALRRRDQPSWQRAETLFLAGVLALEAGRLTAASRRLGAAWRAYPLTSAAPDRRPDIQLGRALICLQRERPQEAWRLVQQARALAEVSNDTRALAHVNHQESMVLLALGRPQEALEASERAVTAYLHLGEPRTVGIGYNGLALAAALGDVDRELDALTRAVEFLDRSGASMIAAIVQNNMAVAERLRGDFAAAATNAWRSWKSLAAAGTPIASAPASTYALCLLYLGDVEAARTALADAPPATSPAARRDLSATQAEIALFLGDVELATQACDAVGAGAEDLEARAQVAALRGWLALLTRDPAAARAHFAQARELCPRVHPSHTLRGLQGLALLNQPGAREELDALVERLRIERLPPIPPWADRGA